MATKRQENIDALIVSESASFQDNTINDVADGIADTDAVNVQQMNTIAVGQGWDEATWDDTTGNLKFLIATILNFTVNLDGRYPTESEVISLISASGNIPPTLIMPTGTSVQERINGMVEGTDYPTGWVLTADGLNLIITHNLGRNLADVTVWANISGDTFNKLEGTSAHATGGLYSYNSANESAVFSLASLQKPINVYLFFA
jgi:hypothetical protein